MVGVQELDLLEKLETFSFLVDLCPLVVIERLVCLLLDLVHIWLWDVFDVGKSLIVVLIEKGYGIISSDFGRYHDLKARYDW